MTCLFFDTETTGIKTRDNPTFKPALVQLGAILQDFDSRRVLAEINLISQVEGPVPAPAAAVHGISKEVTEQFGLSLNGIDGLFANLMARADLLVAHNIAYDIDVVVDNMARSKQFIDKLQLFDTMEGSVYIVRQPLTTKQQVYFTSTGRKPDHPFKYPNLTETYKHFFGKGFEGAHDAMADIRASRDIFFKLIDEGFYTVQDGIVVPTDRTEQLIAGNLT